MLVLTVVTCAGLWSEHSELSEFSEHCHSLICLFLIYMAYSFRGGSTASPAEILYISFILPAHEIVRSCFSPSYYPPLRPPFPLWARWRPSLCLHITWYVKITSFNSNAGKIINQWTQISLGWKYGRGSHTQRH